MAFFGYLSEKGHLSKTSKILDIGSQNLHNATVEEIRAFVEKYKSIDDGAAFLAEAERISYFSTPRAGERTAYISELLALTDMFYTSYDVCPALKTEIMDLNWEHLPGNYHNHFDVVLNVGTTEHIFNQFNSYEVMHDALKTGGIFLHQVPSLGWNEHGYFCYHTTFFDDLAHANGYEILDIWYILAGISRPGSTVSDVRDADRPLEKHSCSNPRGVLPPELLSYNLNVVLRKVEDAPFRVGLELATSHSALSKSMSALYGKDRRLSASAPTAAILSSMHQTLTEAMSEHFPRMFSETVQPAFLNSVQQTVRSATAETVRPSIESALPDCMKRTLPSALAASVPQAIADAMPTVDAAVHTAVADAMPTLDATVHAAVASALQTMLPDAVAQAARDVVGPSVDTASRAAVSEVLRDASMLPDPRYRSLHQTRTSELAREILRRMKGKIGL